MPSTPLGRARLPRRVCLVVIPPATGPDSPAARQGRCSSRFMPPRPWNHVWQSVEAWRPGALEPGKP